MSEQKLLKYLNPIMGIQLLCMLTTGLTADELPEEAFEILHELMGYSLVATTVLHLILNRHWIKNHYFKKKRVN